MCHWLNKKRSVLTYNKSLREKYLHVCDNIDAIGIRKQFFLFVSFRSVILKIEGIIDLLDCMVFGIPVGLFY
jgi:hypothetical protein